MHNVFTIASFFTLVGFVSAVPSFDVNLDDPPEKRWVEVATKYKQSVINILDDLVPQINHWTNKRDWIDDEPVDKEYEQELQGFVDVCDHPSVTLLRLKWLNMLYETDSPMRHGCSDILWAKPDGTVVHGRNLDDQLGKYGSFPKATLDYMGNVFHVTYYKNGVPLITSTAFPGEVGVHTGLRLPTTDGVGGWSFAQNTRTPNDKNQNLRALQQGGQIFPLGVRRIMEKTPEFGDAVKLLYSTKWAAPQYFTVSGSGSLEAGILTIDRLGEHPKSIRHLGGSNNEWYLVQTNDDADEVAKDDRREIATSLLAGATQDITLSEDNMHQMMHTKKLLNDDTLFTTVMVPATGYYETRLPSESPTVADGTALLQQMEQGSFSLSQVAGKVFSSRKSFLAPKVRRQPKWVADLAKDEVSFLQVSLQLDL